MHVGRLGGTYNEIFRKGMLRGTNDDSKLAMHSLAATCRSRLSETEPKCSKLPAIRSVGEAVASQN